MSSVSSESGSCSVGFLSLTVRTSLLLSEIFHWYFTFKGFVHCRFVDRTMGIKMHKGAATNLISALVKHLYLLSIAFYLLSICLVTICIILCSLRIVTVYCVLDCLYWVICCDLLLPNLTLFMHLGPYETTFHSAVLNCCGRMTLKLTLLDVMQS